MASRASRRGPRLPEYLQTRILDFYFAFVADAGGAAVLSKHGRIAPLRLVNKHFKWVAGHQFFNVYWLYDFGFDNSIEAEQLRMMDHNVVKGLERITCPCCVRGSLELRITELDGNKGLEGRSRAVKDMVERVLKVYHRAVEFQLVMTRTTSPLIEVVWRFPLLEKLSVSNRHGLGSPVLCFPPKASLPTLPPTLARIDLSFVFVQSWSIELPSVTTLTLDHVSFGGPQCAEEQSTETSRDFFGSFPKLKAIGFSGLIRFDPVSLARLKISSITHLFIGACAINDKCECRSGRQNVSPAPQIPFLRSLARYFRCRIQHLVLPCHALSPKAIQAILSSHPSIDSYPYPPYLARLQTVRILSPQMFLFGLDKPTIDDISHGILVQGHLHQAGLKNVELKWWKNGKAQNGSMIEWEPEEWNWN